jgi:hypothetical protein
MCVTRRNRIMAFARVVGTIHCPAGHAKHDPEGGYDTPEVMIRKDLVEQIRQHGCIANAANYDLDDADLQRFLINPPLGTLQCNALPVSGSKAMPSSSAKGCTPPSSGSCTSSVFSCS